MATLQLTQVYLDPKQKAALSKKAKAAKVGVSEVIRDAIDAYLAGITVDELRLLESVACAGVKSCNRACQVTAHIRKIDRAD